MKKMICLGSISLLSAFSSYAEHCPEIKDIREVHNVFLADAEQGEWISVMQMGDHERIVSFDSARLMHSKKMMCTYKTEEDNYVDLKLDLYGTSLEIDINDHRDVWNEKQGILMKSYQCGEDGSISNPEDCEFELVDVDDTSISGGVGIF